MLWCVGVLWCFGCCVCVLLRDIFGDVDVNGMLCKLLMLMLMGLGGMVIVYGFSVDLLMDVGGYGSVVWVLWVCEGVDEVCVMLVYVYVYVEKRFVMMLYEVWVEMCVLVFEGVVMDSDVDVGKYVMLVFVGLRGVFASDDDAGETSAAGTKAVRLVVFWVEYRVLFEYRGGLVNIKFGFMVVLMDVFWCE